MQILQNCVYFDLLKMILYNIEVSTTMFYFYWIFIQIFNIVNKERLVRVLTHNKVTVMDSNPDGTIGYFDIESLIHHLYFKPPRIMNEII